MYVITRQKHKSIPKTPHFKTRTENIKHEATIDIKSTRTCSERKHSIKRHKRTVLENAVLKEDNKTHKNKITNDTRTLKLTPQ